MKPCVDCQIAKPLDQFHKRADSADGYARQCKTCRNLKIRAWQKANPDRVQKAKNGITQQTKESSKNIDQILRLCFPVNER